MAMPLLTTAWLLPAISGVLLLLIGNADGRRNALIRWVTLIVSIAAFAVTLVVLALFSKSVRGAPVFSSGTEP